MTDAACGTSGGIQGVQAGGGERRGASRISPAPSTTVKPNWVTADLGLPKPTRATLQVFANNVSTAGDADTPGIHHSFILHSCAH